LLAKQFQIFVEWMIFAHVVSYSGADAAQRGGQQCRQEGMRITDLEVPVSKQQQKMSASIRPIIQERDFSMLEEMKDLAHDKLHL
jgi:hypothetical protein